MRFAKAHAYGNDFLYVEQQAVEGVALEDLARAMCDRHTGIGADGLIVHEGRDDTVSMRILNADGSRAEVSGNGLRALGALALLNDPRPDARLAIETESGTKQVARIGREGSRQFFRVSMGAPTDIRQIWMDLLGERLPLVVLSMGNPQCVLLGPLPDDSRFRRLGRALERHEMFPAGTNVEFAQVERPDRVRILIWERGVGPTTSSGTGSCAALVAAASYGGANRDSEVVAPGGAQRVEWQPDNVYLTGWAEVLCEGKWLGQIPRTR